MSVRFSPQYQTVQLGVSEQLPGPLREQIPTICIAIASIAIATVLHTASPILAIAVETLIGLAIVLAVPTQAPAIAIFFLFFQNLFVAFLSPQITSPAYLDFIRGYNF